MDIDPYEQFYNEFDEVETRRVVNSFIRYEHITLEKWRWRVYDWMEATGHDMKKWVRTTDVLRNEYPLEDAISWGIYYQICRMKHDGSDYPDFIPDPEDWEDFEITRNN